MATNEDPGPRIRKIFQHPGDFSSPAKFSGAKSGEYGVKAGWQWLVGTGLAMSWVGWAVGSPPPSQLEFFEMNVRPLLAERCVECHGGLRAEAGLRLDTRESILRGGDGGKVVRLEDPPRSPLLRAVRHDGESVGISSMPEKGEKLRGDEIEALEAWVKMGLPWPEQVELVATRDPREHWSFQGVKRAEVPGGEHPVDYWVDRELRARGLRGAPPAGPEDLVKRLFYGLTGLPPTYEEVRHWAKRPVDEVIAYLLDSPHYGERWGRHWLDVARYSDVKGYEAGGRERRFIYSYTYRDWVIRALNADMPYDQFVLYQLAAEQLTDEANKEHLAAMGFLTLARHDGRRELLIDDRMDTTFRGLMGLTVSCARCHDHKFDPVPIRDYYSLFGVFANSVAPEEAPLLAEPDDSPAYQAYVEEREKREREVEDFLQPKLAVLAQEFPDLANRSFQLEAKLGGEDKTTLRKLRTKVDEHEANSPHAPSRALILRDVSPPQTQVVYERGDPGRRGEKVERRFLSVLAGEGAAPYEKGSGRLEMARDIVSVDNPLTARVLVNRVWLYHFGEGLVSTPSDFGHQGELPSHPELLDWLASWFVEQGWSLKKLHRLLLTSATWQRASVHPEAGKCHQVDPENRLLWRANRQRLDFESMRDSLLAVSGQLDKTMFGRSVAIEEAPFPGRRTLYAFIDRQNLPGLFKTFDFASPQEHTPRRSYTTVPAQALFSLNHPFLQEQVSQLVERVGLKEETKLKEGVRALFRAVMRRDPSPREEALGETFVKGQGEAMQRDPLSANPQGYGPWQYGYGGRDGEGRTEFTAMPVFQQGRWQPAEEFPVSGSPLSHLHLRLESGHPGASAHMAAVVRWTAPEDGEVEVAWRVRKPSDKGDGIGFGVVRESGIVVEERVEPAETKEGRTGVQSLKRGEWLDFCFDPLERHDFDQFEWEIEIRDARSGALKGSSAEDFRGPEVKATAWEAYAQALFATNEFWFVE